MKERSTLTNNQRELAELMSDISEECYCAWWLGDLEYTLWDLITTPGKAEPFKWGIGEVSVDDQFRLTELSERCGGWIMWDVETLETFVPLDDWQWLVAVRVPEAW